ncbi:hypothetical protein Nepgr_031924 [Nepenthes gracilis]|uniref:RNase H type-1 domain-containing protein n=1 Tax=Nepenthes gracilis TaxID=150966 RepID=A0AAD3TJD3_NEPGR|nr:hypothetical protein Nepgr_031924 [Nepenthes gracilis]
MRIAGFYWSGPHDPRRVEVKYFLRLNFPATNNIVEYEALLAGLRLAKECSVKRLTVYSDSELIVNQVNGDFEVNNPHLARYLEKAMETTQDFDKLTLVHIPRTENWKADQLARAVAAENLEQYSRDMREILNSPSIEKQEAM